MAEKLDFLMRTWGQEEAVKARVFISEAGKTFVDVSGGIFNGAELSIEQLDIAIGILQSVRAAAERVRNDS